MTLSNRGVAWLFVAQAIAVMLTAMVVIDERAHAAAEQTNGVNSRGFRGPLRLTKAGGARIAVIGGGAAYGANVDWEHSLPFYLERRLNQPWRTKYPGTPTDVLNLAMAGDGAGAYVTTLEDYAYLKPDAVCIFDEYTGPEPAGAVRHASAVFTATGYLPITGPLAHRASVAPRPAALDPSLGDSAAGDVSCSGLARAHCAGVIAAVAWITAHGMTVIVVTPPYVSARHEARQASLAALLAQRFAGDRRVRYVNMGRTIDMRDRAQSVDGTQLTAAGNQVVAENLVDAMFEAIVSQ